MKCAGDQTRLASNVMLCKGKAVLNQEENMEDVCLSKKLKFTIKL